MSALSIHTAALNSKFNHFIIKGEIISHLSQGQTGLVRSLLSQDSELLNAQDVVGGTTRSCT